LAVAGDNFNGAGDRYRLWWRQIQFEAMVESGGGM
jgi:hypothetical protein